MLESRSEKLCQEEAEVQKSDRIQVVEKAEFRCGQKGVRPAGRRPQVSKGSGLCNQACAFLSLSFGDPYFQFESAAFTFICGFRQLMLQLVFFFFQQFNQVVEMIVAVAAATVVCVENLFDSV
jgi:hypothetical protein